MIKNHLVKYLLISPTLPVGSFCYSEGLESYIKNKKLEESEDIKELIQNELKIGQIRIEARCLIEFFDIFIDLKNEYKLKYNKQRLLSLDRWLLSFRDSNEIRDQQTQLAKSLFDCSVGTWPSISTMRLKTITDTLDLPRNEGILLIIALALDFKLKSLACVDKERLLAALSTPTAATAAPPITSGIHPDNIKHVPIILMTKTLIFIVKFLFILFSHRPLMIER